MSDVNNETMDEEKSLSPYQSTKHFDLLVWLDAIPLSRPIEDFDRDFSDGVLIAEILNYFLPEYVQLDMFINARNMSQRTQNWRILKCDLLPKIGLYAPGTVVHEIIHGDHRVIELFLFYLREKIEEHLIHTERKSSLSSESDSCFNIERDRVLQSMLTPRIPRRKTSRANDTTSNFDGEHTSSFLYDDNLKSKEKEIDFLNEKLNQCENLLKTKDERIQELESILETLKSKTSST